MRIRVSYKVTQVGVWHFLLATVLFGRISAVEIPLILERERERDSGDIESS